MQSFHIKRDNNNDPYCARQSLHHSAIYDHPLSSFSTDHSRPLSPPSFPSSTPPYFTNDPIPTLPAKTMTLQNGMHHLNPSSMAAMDSIPIIDAHIHDDAVNNTGVALSSQKHRQQMYLASSATALPRDDDAAAAASFSASAAAPSDKPTMRGFKSLKKRFSNSFSRLSVHHPGQHGDDPNCAPPHPRPAALRLLDAEAAAASASPDASYVPSTSLGSFPAVAPSDHPQTHSNITAVRPDSFAPSTTDPPHPHPPNSGSYVSVGDFSPSDDISPSQAMSYVNSSNNTLNEEGYCESNSFNMENSSNSVAAAALMMQQINARPIGTSGSYLMTQSMTIDASDFSDPVTTPSDVAPPSVAGNGAGFGQAATPTRTNKRHSWIKRLISSAKAKALVKQSRATWSLEGHLDDLGHSRGSAGGGGGGRDDHSTKAATLSRDVSQDEICDRLAQQHHHHHHRASEAGDLDGLDSTGGSPKSIPSTPKSEFQLSFF